MTHYFVLRKDLATKPHAITQILCHLKAHDCTFADPCYDFYLRNHLS